MKGQGFSIRGGGIFGFIFLIMVLVVLFFIAKGIFKLLAFASPFLILGAVIINYRTVLNYLRFVLSLFKRSVLVGIIAVLLSFLGFPILSGILFGKAILDRKVLRLQREHRLREEGEFINYEEVSRRPLRDDLELPPLEKREAEKKDNPYKDFF